MRLCALTAFTALVGVGCGPQVAPPLLEPMAPTAQAAREKIRNALIKVGVTQDAVAVMDLENEWMITLPSAGEFGDVELAIRAIPERALVDKQTLRVHMLNPEGSRGLEMAPIPSAY